MGNLLLSPVQGEFLLADLAMSVFKSEESSVGEGGGGGGIASGRASMWVVRKVQGGNGHKSEGVGGYGGGGNGMSKEEFRTRTRSLVVELTRRIFFSAFEFSVCV